MTQKRHSSFCGAQVNKVIELSTYSTKVVRWGLRSARIIQRLQSHAVTCTTCEPTFDTRMHEHLTLFIRPPPFLQHLSTIPISTNSWGQIRKTVVAVNLFLTSVFDFLARFWSNRRNYVTNCHEVDLA